NECRGIGHGSEDTTLHRDHLQRGAIIAVIGRASTIGEHQTLIAAIVGIAHRGVNANVGGDSTKHDVLNSAPAKKKIQICRIEGSFSRLVDNRFAFERRQFRYDFPAWLTTNENLSARPLVADTGTDALAAPSFVCRQVRQIRTMALTRVHDMKSFRAGLAKNTLNWPNWRAREGNVVAHLVDVAAFTTEIGLHVDN